MKQKKSLMNALKKEEKKLEEKNTIPICDELTVCFLVQKKKIKNSSVYTLLYLCILLLENVVYTTYIVSLVFFGGSLNNNIAIS